MTLYHLQKYRNHIHNKQTKERKKKLQKKRVKIRYNMEKWVDWKHAVYLIAIKYTFSLWKKKRLNCYIVTTMRWSFAYTKWPWFFFLRIILMNDKNEFQISVRKSKLQVVNTPYSIPFLSFIEIFIYFHFIKWQKILHILMHFMHFMPMKYWKLF